MKLKTLLLVVAILCVSLFVVACGEDETTTAEQGGENTTTAATTKATTKKTTAEKTTKATTTTVTTTLDPNYKNILPAKLPDNSTFDIHTRIGLDAEADIMAISGNYANGKFTTTGAIYGGAWSMELDTAKNSRMEAYVDLMDPFTPEGVKGIMWYVDFSAVAPAEGKEMCTSTTINTNAYRSKLDANVAGSGIGYYYKDGAWVETQAINACRMQIPSQFKGWIYVPLTSYNGAADLYDAGTKLGLGNVFVQNIRLYTDHYVFEAGKPIIFDEIIYVK